MLDLKDLRALLSELSERGSRIATDYGNVDRRTIGAIQRRLIVLEEQGGENFFGEPALDIKDLMRTTRDGRGMINMAMSDFRDGCRITTTHTGRPNNTNRRGLMLALQSGM